MAEPLVRKTLLPPASYIRLGLSEGYAPEDPTGTQQSIAKRLFEERPIRVLSPRSPDSGEARSGKAQLAARAAIEVANRTGSKLHLVHAGEPGGLSLTHRAPGVGEKVCFPAEAVEEFEKRARELLEEQVGKIEKAGGTVAKAHLRTGRPVTEVVNLSEELGAGFAVVGSRGHSGIKRLVLSSVSENVVHHAHCSVLVAREEAREDEGRA